MDEGHPLDSKRSLAPGVGQAVRGASLAGGQSDLQAACTPGGIIWTENSPPKELQERL